MEESEPAFNQFVTLEQNRSKKKKNNNKKASYFNQISPPFKQQNDQRTEVAGAQFPSRSPRKGQISRPPLTRERRPEEDFAF